MKVILIILSYLFICETSSYTLKRIEGVPGYAKPIEFDREGNAYAVSPRVNHEDKSRLYKLNSSDEVVQIVDLPDHVEYAMTIRITRQHDIYFIFNIGGPNFSLEIMRANSTETTRLEQLTAGEHFYDGDGNLVYTKKDAGVYVIRTKSTVPVAVTGLENFHIAFNFRTSDIVYGIDRTGNIYLEVASGTFLDKTNCSIAVITKEALQQDIPQATFLNAFDNPNQEAQNLVVDDQNNLWIAIKEEVDGIARKGIIKKVVNGKVETVFIDQKHPFVTLMSAKDRIFVIARNYRDASIYYVTLNNERVKIPELKNWTPYDSLIKKVTDSEGNAYFSSYSNHHQFEPLTLIKANETTPVVCEFSENMVIENIKMDINENLWFSTKLGTLHYLKKGETDSKSVKKDLDKNCTAFDLEINSVTKKFYVSCTEGLYNVEND